MQRAYNISVSVRTQEDFALLTAQAGNSANTSCWALAVAIIARSTQYPRILECPA